jgi:hypothetical protein
MSLRSSLVNLFTPIEREKMSRYASGEANVLSGRHDILRYDRSSLNRISSGHRQGRVQRDSQAIPRLPREAAADVGAEPPHWVSRARRTSHCRDIGRIPMIGRLDSGVLGADVSAESCHSCRDRAPSTSIEHNTEIFLDLPEVLLSINLEVFSLQSIPPAFPDRVRCPSLSTNHSHISMYQ